jgi:DNA-binding transcriptional LysR family regulator
MNLPQVRYFLALCETRQFTRAARRCGVSQPSLTVAIATLEDELGGALFLRWPVVTLTGLGQAVYPYFERIAENAEHAREVARTLTCTRAALSDAAVSDQPTDAASRTVVA